MWLEWLLSLISMWLEWLLSLQQTELYAADFQMCHIKCFCVVVHFIRRAADELLIKAKYEYFGCQVSDKDVRKLIGYMFK